MTKTQTIILIAVAVAITIGVAVNETFALLTAVVETMLIATFLGLVIIPMANDDKEDEL